MLKKSSTAPINPAKRQEIAELLSEGYTAQSIANYCEVSLSTVKRIKRQIKDGTF